MLFRSYNFIERGLDGLARGYRGALGWSLRHRLVMAGFVLVTLAATYWLFGIVPRTLAPIEDRGQIMTIVRAPQGSTAAYTDRAMRQIEEIMLEIPEVSTNFAIVAGDTSFISSALAFDAMISASFTRALP